MRLAPCAPLIPAAALLIAGTLAGVPYAQAVTPTSSQSSAAASSTASNSAPSVAKTAPTSDLLADIPSENVISAQELYELVEGVASQDAETPGRPGSTKGNATGPTGSTGSSPSKTSVTNPEEDAVAIIDIRSLAVFSEKHIPGAKCVPAGKVFSIRMREVPRDQTVVLIDADGSRVAEAWQMLMDNDYDPTRVLVVLDGMDAWFAADYPTLATPIRLGC